MSNETQLEAVELSIEQAKESIFSKDALDKLTKNDAFKKVILDGYFVDEASRLVLLNAEPSMQGETEQAAIQKSIIAIGYLRQYFHTIMQLGAMAERALADDELTREELLRGDL